MLRMSVFIGRHLTINKNRKRKVRNGGSLIVTETDCVAVVGLTPQQLFVTISFH